MKGKIHVDLSIPQGKKAADVIKEPKVIAGIQSGIATKVGVNTSWVKVVLSLDTSAGSGRRLAEVAKLIVDYTINIPAKEVAKTTGIEKALKADTADQKTAWGKSIGDAINKETAETYTLTVSAMPAPTTAEASTSPGGSTSAKTTASPTASDAPRSVGRMGFSIVAVIACSFC